MTHEFTANASVTLNDVLQTATLTVTYPEHMGLYATDVLKQFTDTSEGGFIEQVEEILSDNPDRTSFTLNAKATTTEDVVLPLTIELGFDTERHEITIALFMEFGEQESRTNLLTELLMKGDMSVMSAYDRGRESSASA